MLAIEGVEDVVDEGGGMVICWIKSEKQENIGTNQTHSTESRTRVCVRADYHHYILRIPFSSITVSGTIMMTSPAPLLYLLLQRKTPQTLCSTKYMHPLLRDLHRKIPLEKGESTMLVCRRGCYQNWGWFVLRSGKHISVSERECNYYQFSLHSLSTQRPYH